MCMHNNGNDCSCLLLIVVLIVLFCGCGFGGNNGICGSRSGCDKDDCTCC